MGLQRAQTHLGRCVRDRLALPYARMTSFRFKGTLSACADQQIDNAPLAKAAFYAHIEPGLGMRHERVMSACGLHAQALVQQRAVAFFEQVVAVDDLRRAKR